MRTLVEAIEAAYHTNPMVVGWVVGTIIGCAAIAIANIVTKHIARRIWRV